jgi:shikimate kinase
VSAPPNCPAPEASTKHATRPIILVGMMGSGKTTVGRRLAARLNREFVDADRDLESRCGVPISTIFELEGEEGFRRREASALDALTQRRGLVLATGGGAVLLAENRERLHARGFVVFLRAGPAELWQRLKRDKVRPLLRTENPRQRISELTTQREPLYREIAHLTVTSGRMPIDMLVADIIRRLPDDLSPGSDCLPPRASL